MKQIALLTNFNINEKRDVAYKILQIITSYNCNAFITENRLQNDILIQFPTVSVVSFFDIFKNVDLCIVLGGDGTVLNMAYLAAENNVPVLGINMGHFGFMSELEVDEIEEKLPSIIMGNYETENHTMIHISIMNEHGHVYKTASALNEVVFGNGSITRLIDLEIYNQLQQKLFDIRADGIMFVTPTGSTAYSLSAGGPIINPHLPCFCMTPICAQNPNIKPYVYQENDIIFVKNVCQREKQLFITLDGHFSFDFYKNQYVRIQKSDKSLTLVRVKKDDFIMKYHKKTSNSDLFKNGRSTS